MLSFKLHRSTVSSVLISLMLGSFASHAFPGNNDESLEDGRATSFKKNPGEEVSSDPYDLRRVYSVEELHKLASIPSDEIRKRIDLQKKVPEAQYCLGMMYGYGVDVVPDPEKAVKWFHLASEHGYVDARDGLKSFIDVRPHEGSLSLKKFETTEIQSDKIKLYLDRLGFFANLFKPKDGFKDSSPFNGHYNSFSGLIADLETYQSLIPFFKNPGFLLTNITRKYGESEGRANPHYLKRVFVGGETYYCIGESNVEAGEDLVRLIKDMEDQMSFNFLNYIYGDLLDINNDIQFWETRTQQIDDMKEGFKDLAKTLEGFAKDYAESRNQAFYEKVFGENR